MARKTKAEALATRERLLDAAEHLFQARGVSGTSLQDIAEAAGMTRGAVYWHFRDKADLFNAMMERVRLPLEDAAAGASPDRDGAVQRVRALLVGTLQRVVACERVHRVYEIALHKVEYVDEMAGVRARHVQAIEAYVGRLERNLRAAGLAPRRAALQARGLHALLAGLIQTWMLAPARFDLVQEGRRLIDAQLAPLSADASAPSQPGVRASAPVDRVSPRRTRPASAGPAARR